MRRLRFAGGVTLIELLLVVFVLAALSAIAIPRISRSATENKAHLCEKNLRMMNEAIELYAADHQGRYPARLDLIFTQNNYLPDGKPQCPLGGTYRMSPYFRVECSHGAVQPGGM